jgi:hypothetical protein
MRGYNMLMGLSLGLFGCNAFAAEQCPDLTSANVAIQARADQLIKRIDEYVNGLPMVSGASATVPDFIVSLTGVIVARAKEEARIWLIEQISDTVCDVAQPQRRAYFPNTCKAVDVGASYPGISMTALRTELRKDIYALPACHEYLTNRAGPLAGIDAYVFEAALVAAYYVHNGKEPPEGTPTIDKPDLRNEDIAKLLVAAVTAKLDLQSFPSASAEKCPRKTKECVSGAIADIKTLLDNEASPEKILAYLLKQVDTWDDEMAADLRLFASAYLAGAKGNYTEVALNTAAHMNCDTAPLNRLCVHLPLLAEVADANTQEEMSAALDHAISPLGAWKRKQSEPVAALNSMAGVAVGYETLESAGDRASHSTMGLYLPIGIEYSWPVEWRWIRSVAGGVSVLDLGGLVSYSQKDDLAGGETSSGTNSNWSSVTSPGVYLAFAFKDSPFRAGFSASRTPELRSVNFSDGVEKSLDSTRYLLFVAVDVTLLGF